jgi:hypothetical protein
MTKIYTLFAGLLLACSLHAQTQDTLLIENFNWEDYDHTVDWSTIPFGDDQTFVNFDEDGFTPDGGDAIQFRWYWTDAFFAPDTIPNGVLASKSWMEGFLPGNRNWFIFPPVTIPDSTYTLSWKSAPRQLLRYMDGYTVLGAEGTNDIFSNAFTDTLFRAAQMIDIVGDGDIQTVDNFTFSEGYIHADGATKAEYLALDPNDPNLYVGYLEPHTVSLSAYAGKTMYFAILHDSDDDNLLMIDDILVVGGASATGTNAPNTADFRFTTYPNPIENNLNVLFRLPQAAAVSLQVSDMTGKIVRRDLQSEQLQAGEHQRDLRLGDLPKGAYNVTLVIGEQSLSKVLVKK